MVYLWKRGDKQIFIKYTELGLLVMLAVISDIRIFKIKNIIIIVFTAAGLATNFITGGLPALTGSALAAVLPIPLLFVLYLPKMLGAGDIKLFCAIGAIGGAGFVLYAMAYSFIAGGFIAAGIMLVNKSFRQRGKYLVEYLKTCFLTRSLPPYTDFGNKSDGAKFRFSCAAACGVFIKILLELASYI